MSKNFKNIDWFDVAIVSLIVLVIIIGIVYLFILVMLVISGQEVSTSNGCVPLIVGKMVSTICH